MSVHKGNKQKPTTAKTKIDTQNKRWATFTYVGREVRSITNIFKHTNLQIAFTTKNNIGKLLSATPCGRNTDMYEKSGVCGLTCQACKRRYVGQTGRPFHVRFKEHAQDYKPRTKKSYFAKHLLECDHPFHPIEETMDIIHTTEKGRMLNVIETVINNQLNDRSTVAHNVIFDTILRNMDTHSVT
jgi:hypothetical protein